MRVLTSSNLDKPKLANSALAQVLCKDELLLDGNQVCRGRSWHSNHPPADDAGGRVPH